MQTLMDDSELQCDFLCENKELSSNMCTGAELIKKLNLHWRGGVDISLWVFSPRMFHTASAVWRRTDAMPSSTWLPRASPYSDH